MFKKNGNTRSGIGIRFDGFPTDIKKFYFILTDQGCHPKAVHRILTRLNKKGYDLLTVMYYLDFNWIQKELKTIGIRMSSIEPLKDWKQKYYDGHWPEWAIPERIKK